jgi:tRNA(Arg) A34 adenosine deaminase TadA
MYARDYKHMELCRRLAIDSPGMRNVKMAAIMTSKNQIVSIGFNSLKTHPFQKRYAKHEMAIHLHAEIGCISNALNHVSRRELARCTLYVYRVKKPSQFSAEFVDGLAKPCEGCAAAIRAFEVGRVMYSTDEPETYEET